jgi:hypothetical protein
LCRKTKNPAKPRAIEVDKSQTTREHERCCW